MLVQKAYRQLAYQLQTIYELNEANIIADWVMEHVTSLHKTDRLMNNKVELTAIQKENLQSITTDLMNHKPVQYVLNESWFAGMKLYVDEHVLIPRPETEELVNWVINDYSNEISKQPQTIIDIGTGSGCIPVAIKNQYLL